MRVLLTGASGFVGQVARRILIAANHEVVSVVRSSEQKAHFAPAILAELGDESFADNVLAAMPSCDAVVHAAADIYSEPFDARLIQVNCLGTQQVCFVAKQLNAKMLVYISSAPVIGKPLTNLIAEEHVTNPRSAYHATKLFGEHIAAATAHSEMNVASLRLTSPVGAGMPAGRIFSAFVSRAMNAEPLMLIGKGGRVQNYVDVRDVGNAILGCLQHRANGVYQIGGGRSISNFDLAKLCIHALGSNSEIEFIPKPDPAEKEVWTISIERAKSAFDYKPAFDLESSIKALAASLQL